MMYFTHAVDNIHVFCASNLYFIGLISLFFILIHHPLHLQSPHVQSLKINNVWHSDSICGEMIEVLLRELYTKRDAIQKNNTAKCDQ